MTAIALLAGLILLIIVLGRFRTLDRGARSDASGGVDRATLERQSRKRRKRTFRQKRR